VGQIKELIETRVRPAVAQDGGDIVFEGVPKLLEGLYQPTGDMFSFKRSITFIFYFIKRSRFNAVIVHIIVLDVRLCEDLP